MEKKASKLSILTKGIIKENPVLVLLLGTCPTLATTSSAINGIGMGVSATAVLICSNIVISLLRKIIPDKVRIPCYIVVIAGFVTVVQLLLQAFVPSLYASLGLFIPLIVVNCIILGRAEMFASKNNAFDSALDGIGMGIGFTLALGAMGLIREFFGSGTAFGINVLTDIIPGRRNLAVTDAQCPQCAAAQEKNVRKELTKYANSNNSDEYDLGKQLCIGAVPGYLSILRCIKETRLRSRHGRCRYLRNGSGHDCHMADHETAQQF